MKKLILLVFSILVLTGCALTETSEPNEVLSTTAQEDLDYLLIQFEMLAEENTRLNSEIEELKDKINYLYDNEIVIDERVTYTISNNSITLTYEKGQYEIEIEISKTANGIKLMQYTYKSEGEVVVTDYVYKELQGLGSSMNDKDLATIADYYKDYIQENYTFTEFKDYIVN